ncbi:MAG: YeeE/YedE family protein [Neomegalonema sp.]|nr:YeeE/YedE family protein [Neomegalonema sp.]
MQIGVIIGAILALLWVVWRAADEGGSALGGAALVGAVGGVALYHAAFGFTAGWRRLVRERRGAGFRAQLLLLALASVITLPLISYGEAIGVRASGWVFPMSLTSAFGAALFGFGMQLGGGCGSGTLFTVGGGSSRMLLTLLAFIAGSVLWSGTGQIFNGSPSVGAHSLIGWLGTPGAVLVTLSLLGVLAALTIRLERARHGEIEHRLRDHGSVLQGPWSMSLGALVLAGVIVATFVTLGRPWGITSAFPSWGIKLLEGIGVPVLAWNGWSPDVLSASVFANSTGVMNFGVMLGALLAAGLAGRFAPVWRLSARDIGTALIGGVLMGYGARLGFGCNIGGFVGGVVSGSLHGWWWLIFGFAGSALGVWMRARIGMDPPLVWGREEGIKA